MVKQALVLPVVILMSVFFGCRSFHPPAPPPELPLADDIVVNLRGIDKTRTVSIDGEMVEGEFIARRLKVREEDGEVELKGVISAIDDNQHLFVEGFEFLLTDETRVVDSRKQPETAGHLAPGQWVKVEAKLKGSDVVLRKVTLRDRQGNERVQISGEIEEIEHGRGLVTIGTIPVRLPDDTLAVWDSDLGEPPAELLNLDPHIENPIHPGLKRVRRIDDDDRRPEDQLRLGDFLIVGGEVQYEVEWRNNFDLRDDLERDRAFQDASATIEASANFNRHLGGFFKLSGTQRWIIADQSNNLDGGEDINFQEAWLILEDITPGFSVQLGRQDFDNGREWVMDDTLDALRLWFNFGDLVLETSVSEVLFDESPESNGVTNFLVAAHLEPIPDQKLFVYALQRRNGRAVDLERTHLGLSAEGEFSDFSWWLDVGTAFGKEDDIDISGFGTDLSLMYVFREIPLEPSLYVGFAYGSGDDDLSDGDDGNFRQTGLHDNNDRFNGVTSFRYLGELLQPDLSNLLVFSLGIGIRPSDDTSIDIVFHHYEQAEAAPFLGDTRLRTDRPNGVDRDIGQGLDLILGLEMFRPLEIEIVISWFHPGDAFSPLGQDDAWFINSSLEYNF